MKTRLLLSTLFLGLLYSCSDEMNSIESPKQIVSPKNATPKEITTKEDTTKHNSTNFNNEELQEKRITGQDTIRRPEPKRTKVHRQTVDPDRLRAPRL